jgi:hypothetical protein
VPGGDRSPLGIWAVRIAAIALVATLLVVLAMIVTAIA